MKRFPFCCLLFFCVFICVQCLCYVVEFYFKIFVLFCFVFGGTYNKYGIYLDMGGKKEKNNKKLTHFMCTNI